MSQVIALKHYHGAARKFTILTPEEIKKSDFFRANAYAMEIKPTELGKSVAILKTFFIDDTVNENDWQTTWEGLKEDAKELPGVPLVLQEDLEHPKFSVQQYFDRGTIFDYDIDEENHKIIVYVRITDPKIIERIKSGELEYVSPAVIPRGSEYLRNENGVDILDRSLPLHLAIVGNPAYGKEKAKISHLCTGDGKECYHRLKMMTAAKEIYESAESCVSRKIQIIKDEKPSISNEQAAAIAYSMCREGTASNGDGTGSPNSGIKSNIKYLNNSPLTASLDKIASVLDQVNYNMEYPIYQGKEGYWIKAKNQDVFVARNQLISQALTEQCGCEQLNTYTD